MVGLSIGAFHFKPCCDVAYSIKFVSLYTLQPAMKEVDLNGVWNLVLSCSKCNRGLDGKFAKVPIPKYIERLHKRNEFLISSHHPLRETLMSQTGATTNERIAFIRNVDNLAINLLIHRWSVALAGKEIF